MLKKTNKLNNMAGLGCTKFGRCSAALWERYNSGRIAVIPDIKCKSPAEGDLLRGRDPVLLAQSLAEAGAPLLSVVTETEHFGGSLQLLHRIAAAVKVPVLRKDFITSAEQLHESAENGADGVLLIAALLGRKQLFELIDIAIRLGLEPLVETHDEAEIISLGEQNLTFLGINNRSIVEWEVDNGSVATTERLATLVRPGVLIVSESSIASTQEVRRALNAGAHAVLVGTAILRANDPLEKYRELSAAD